MADPLDAACAVVPRNLSWREWQKYMNQPYHQACPASPMPPDVVASIKGAAAKLIHAGEFISATVMLDDLNGWLAQSGQRTSFGVDITPFTVDALLEEGRRLVLMDDVEGAIAKFTSALALDESLEIEPNQLAEQVAAAFESARQLDPSIESISSASKALVTDGDNLASIGEIISATHRFEEAVRLDPSWQFAPEQEAKRVAAEALMDQGRTLIYESDLEGAIAKFKEAVVMDEALTIDPEQYAKQLASRVFLEVGQILAEEGEVDNATRYFEEALMLDVSLGIDPQQEAERLVLPLLTMGVPVTSTTADISTWRFAGTAGQSITISLIDTEDGPFDPQLTLTGPNGETVVEDDDGGGGSDGYDALIEGAVLPEDGWYFIHVGREGSSAVYELSLRVNQPN